MNLRILALLLIASTSASFAAGSGAPPSPGTPTSPTASTPSTVDPSRLARWQDQRFGMFIHWGPVALTGKEIGWSRGRETPIEEYDALHKRFTAPSFDANAWASAAKAAGMKYVVLTTKHHDGFCLWDTKQTDHNIMRSPLGRDVVKELAEACRRQGLDFGTYYSTCDWHHPDFPRTSPGGKVKRETHNLDRYESYLRAQVKELITQYGPLSVLWFDVPQEFDAKRGQGVVDYVRALQPTIVINNRTGAPGDYDTPEQRVGGYRDDRPWETCMTICNQWAWKPDDPMKSLARCLQTLVYCAGGNGNLLFNVGPTADGDIEARQVERLKEMGTWLGKYGESIYGTRGGPVKPSLSIATTRSDRSIFVHVLRWGAGEEVALPALPRRLVASRALTGGDVRAKQSPDGIRLSLPAADRDPIDTIIRLDFDASVMDLPAVDPLDVLTATASHSLPSHPALHAVDGRNDTWWEAGPTADKPILEIDLQNRIRISQVELREHGTQAISRFRLEYHDGTRWRLITEGKTVGHWWKKSFPAAEATRLRLTILEASRDAAISDVFVLGAVD